MMNFKSLLLFFFAFLLQSCYVPVHRDYNGFSKSLVFNQNKRWLINEVYSDLNATQREHLNQKALETFQNLSGRNAFSMSSAKKENLITASIPFSPALEDLEMLKNNTNFDYLVNIRTKKIYDQISSIELENPLQYSKNEAFAIVEIYDLKTLKRIYFQKASSKVSMEKKKTYPETSGEELYQENMQGKNKGSYFHYSSDALSIKNLRKILKDIEKNAIK